MATGVAVAGLLGGGYSAYESSRKASQNQRAQEQQYQSDLAMRLGLQAQQTGLYGPLENKLVQEASSDQPLWYGQMAGQVNQQYDAGQRNVAAQMASRGLGGSALQGATTAGMEMGRAGALSQAFAQGLQARQALGLNMVSRYQPLMNAMYTSGGYGQLGGYYGQQAGMYNNAAQQGWGNVGSAPMNLAQMWPGADQMQTATGQNISTEGAASPFQPVGGQGLTYNPSVFGLQPQQPTGSLVGQAPPSGGLNLSPSGIVPQVGTTGWSPISRMSGASANRVS